MNEQNSILKDAADDEIEEGEIIDDDDDEADKLEMISDGEIVDHEDDKIYTKKFKKNKSRRYDNTPTSSSRSATASKEKEEKMYKMISIDQSFMDDSSFKKKVLCEKYKNDPRHQFATSETEFVRFNAASIHDPSAALTLKPSQNHELSHDITQGEEEACFSPIAPIYELSKPVPLDEIPMPKEEDYHHFTQSYSTSESAAISQAFFNHSAPFQNNQQQ
uniref:Uncharacterized protein n=1 Tax=Panagrolaimus sp. ES5 TaxID=591445 RepID=A0AC34G6A4_9BILA